MLHQRPAKLWSRDMFNIGFGELAVICIVLIIAVGPERLPSMMKTLGKTIRTLRQASRDIRASTGIDELMREDFDLYAPLKPAPARRPAPLPAPEPEPEPEAVAAAAADVPRTPASNVELEPKPVSREDVVDTVDTVEDADRPSVVVAPAPQAVGLPPETLPEAAPPEVITGVEVPQPTAATGLPAATEKPFASNGDTLPRAAIIQNPAAEAPATQPQAPVAPVNEAAPTERKPSGP